MEESHWSNELGSLCLQHISNLPNLAQKDNKNNKDGFSSIFPWLLHSKLGKSTDRARAEECGEDNPDQWGDCDDFLGELGKVLVCQNCQY